MSELTHAEKIAISSAKYKAAIAKRYPEPPRCPPFIPLIHTLESFPFENWKECQEELRRQHQELEDYRLAMLAYEANRGSK